MSKVYSGNLGFPNHSQVNADRSRKDQIDSYLKEVKNFVARAIEDISNTEYVRLELEFPAGLAEEAREALSAYFFGLHWDVEFIDQSPDGSQCTMKMVPDIQYHLAKVEWIYNPHSAIYFLLKRSPESLNSCQEKIIRCFEEGRYEVESGVYLIVTMKSRISMRYGDNPLCWALMKWLERMSWIMQSVRDEGSLTLRSSRPAMRDVHDANRCTPEAVDWEYRIRDRVEEWQQQIAPMLVEQGKACLYVDTKYGYCRGPKNGVFGEPPEDFYRLGGTTATSPLVTEAFKRLDVALDRADWKVEYCHFLREIRGEDSEDYYELIITPKG